MKAPIKPQKSLRRRDATGHLDPKYAADLRQRSLASAPAGEQVAFLGRARSSDSLAEALGEEFLQAATSGEGAGTAGLNGLVSEEDGGPFVVTRGKDEFARGPDASNPLEATREPFPMASMAASPSDSEGESD
jgi:hypothetical protein